MDKCPYKLIDIVDKCGGRCRPLEAVYNHSGLSCKDGNYSARNVLVSYGAITLDDFRRDGGIVIRSFTGKLRNSVGKVLPERLNQYITTVDQRIAFEETSNAGLESYLDFVGEVGGNIFNLSIPPNSSYDEQFVTEAGSLSSQLMVMGDMHKDLPKDIKSGSYNPLKNAEVRPRFNELFSNAKGQLKSLMSKTSIEKMFDYKGRNICSDERAEASPCCCPCLCCCC